MSAEARGVGVREGSGEDRAAEGGQAHHRLEQVERLADLVAGPSGARVMAGAVTGM
ncbi:hypothetical protein ACFWWT_38360 [Streptomyces sp. NPDC058676]|uniref:hypothetical protein n=1 Tax=unclassified Streptomyces TaxID=2593676 RepID=UPI00364BA6C1